jgi:hypothetical protein
MTWYGLDLSGSGYGTTESSCRHGNKPSSYLKCCDILEKLSDWQLLKAIVPREISSCILFKRSFQKKAYLSSFVLP